MSAEIRRKLPLMVTVVAQPPGQLQSFQGAILKILVKAIFCYKMHCPKKNRWKFLQTSASAPCAVLTQVRLSLCLSTPPFSENFFLGLVQRKSLLNSILMVFLLCHLEDLKVSYNLFNYQARLCLAW